MLCDISLLLLGTLGNPLHMEQYPDNCSSSPAAWERLRLCSWWSIPDYCQSRHLHLHTLQHNFCQSSQPEEEWLSSQNISPSYALSSSRLYYLQYSSIIWIQWICMLLFQRGCSERKMKKNVNIHFYFNYCLCFCWCGICHISVSKKDHILRFLIWILLWNKQKILLLVFFHV